MISRAAIQAQLFLVKLVRAVENAEILTDSPAERSGLIKAQEHRTINTL